MSRKVVVALSGGVDSSVAALVLKERGYSVLGATLLLQDECGHSGAKSCCAYEDILSAREAADKLGIHHFVLDQRSLFDETVKQPFLEGIRSGSTPNPCVVCNSKIKFGFLLGWARSQGAELLATGHYARLETLDGKARLLRGLDKMKDQSYFLFDVGEEILQNVLFPLGSMTKTEVRKKASEAGLPNFEKPESQDICFGSGVGLSAFLSENGFTEEEGPIVLRNGKRIGTHSGLWNYTVGQRKGIAVPFSEPLYVTRKDLRSNALVVGTKEEASRRRFRIGNWRWRGGESAGELDMQVRYRQVPRRARILEAEGIATAECLAETEVAAPGQAAVGYLEDRVVGGGWIEDDQDDR